MREKIQATIVAAYNMLNQLSRVLILVFGPWHLFGSWNPQFHLELDLSNVEPRLSTSSSMPMSKLNHQHQIGQELLFLTK